MANAAQERLARQFFASMPWRAKAAMYAGVFFSFAPLGLLQTTLGLKFIPWVEIALVSVYSGVVAVVYAITANRAPRWMPVPIALHLLLTAGMMYGLPERPPVTILEGASLAAMAQRLQLASVLTIGSVLLAFICFFAAIRREGLRFTAAHTEIRLARDIHGTLVPPLAGVDGSLEWRGVSRPSGEVGGDVVDVITSAQRWTATIADVSGHGVAAGVLMGMYKTAFRTAAPRCPEVGALTAEINSVMAQLRQPHMFITAALLTIDRTGLVSYVLAGHPPMLHLHAADGRADWVGESQLALTLIDDVQYESRTLTLQPGDVLIVVTDGLTEVFDRRDRELGLDGVREAVTRVGAGVPLERLEHAVFEACRAHGAQADDQTLLIVRMGN